MATVQIGGIAVGSNEPCFVIAEIGINHNGDVEIAKKLIDLARAAGCDAVKFQKRNPDLCVPENQKLVPRETPWGTMTYLEYKHRIELGRAAYDEIDEYCRRVGILWFASCWDLDSLGFMDAYNPPCYKIASACLTDDELLRHTCAKGLPVILSTGMSTVEEIDHAVEVMGLDDLILLHTVSTYPAQYEELNLRVIPFLRERYGVPVGYSGHETGIPASVGAFALGACAVERHITLDRAMWGTDQSASLGPSGITRLVRDIRLVEKALGDGVKQLHPKEVSIRAKLRRSEKEA